MADHRLKIDAEFDAAQALARLDQLEKEVKQLLRIPENKRIGLIITLGYPADNYRQRVKSRKSVNQMSSKNVYPADDLK